MERRGPRSVVLDCTSHGAYLVRSEATFSAGFRLLLGAFRAHGNNLWGQISQQLGEGRIEW